MHITQSPQEGWVTTTKSGTKTQDGVLHHEGERESVCVCVCVCVFVCVTERRREREREREGDQPGALQPGLPSPRGTLCHSDNLESENGKQQCDKIPALHIKNVSQK